MKATERVGGKVGKIELGEDFQKEEWSRYVEAMNTGRYEPKRTDFHSNNNRLFSLTVSL